MWRVMCGELASRATRLTIDTSVAGAGHLVNVNVITSSTDVYSTTNVTSREDGRNCTCIARQSRASTNTRPHNMLT